VVVTGAVLSLTACAPTYPVTAPSSPVQTPTPAQIQTPVAPSEAQPPAQALPSAPRSPIPPPTARGRDQCGAAELQGLIGRPRTEIPVPLDPQRQRVACTTCPAAEDSDPGRLNFLFDAQTGRIRQIRCG
jgi:hypothetical protein